MGGWVGLGWVGGWVGGYMDAKVGRGVLGVGGLRWDCRVTFVSFFLAFCPSQSCTTSFCVCVRELAPQPHW